MCCLRKMESIQQRRSSRAITMENARQARVILEELMSPSGQLSSNITVKARRTMK